MSITNIYYFGKDHIWISEFGFHDTMQLLLIVFLIDLLYKNLII